MRGCGCVYVCVGVCVCVCVGGGGGGGGGCMIGGQCTQHTAHNVAADIPGCHSNQLGGLLQVQLLFMSLIVSAFFSSDQGVSHGLTVSAGTGHRGR